MSLTNLLTGMLDQHGDTIQQAALLAYLKQGEEAQPYLEVFIKINSETCIKMLLCDISGRVDCQTCCQCLQNSEQGGQVRGCQGRDHPSHREVGQGAPQSDTGTNTGRGGQAD